MLLPWEEANMSDALLATIEADEHRDVGGVQVDIARTGNVRVKRMIYPPGFNWDANLKTVWEPTCACTHTSASWLRDKSMSSLPTAVSSSTRLPSLSPWNLGIRDGSS